MNAIDNVEMIKKMKELIETLNHASDAYYNSTPIMEDKEWDLLYSELQNLESESGIVYPDSPTQNVGYKIIDSIKKEEKYYIDLYFDTEKTREYLSKDDMKGMESKVGTIWHIWGQEEMAESDGLKDIVKMDVEDTLNSLEFKNKKGSR